MAIYSSGRQATDEFMFFFKEHPETPGYFKLLDVGGNTKVGTANLTFVFC